MPKAVKILLLSFSVILLLGIAGYQIGKRYALNRVKDVLSEDTVKQLDGILRELAFNDSLTNMENNAEQAIDYTDENKTSGGADGERQGIGTGDGKSGSNGDDQDTEQSGNLNLPALSDDIVPDGIDIEEAARNVPMSDQVRAMQLLLKADIGYVMEITRPGLTSAVKEELQEYMNEIYTDDEIQEVYTLFSRYAHLLVE